MNTNYLQDNIKMIKRWKLSGAAARTGVLKEKWKKKWVKIESVPFKIKTLNKLNKSVEIING